ncbi:MAG TPA: hypothetical protein VLZ33_00860 [Dysgonamonadaceae bacterium]|nr:hypothetical protein [Dysgonamonadaceae bacterium]
MDIGDIGFLIIALIVFIINFIAKANKDKAKAQKPAVPELTEPWEVEEILPPFPEKRKEVAKKKTPRPLSSTQDFIEKMESQKMHKQFSQEGMSSLSQSLFKEDSMDSISYDKDTGSSSDAYSSSSSLVYGLFQGDTAEELKKGIIYSEILHRKYE